MRNSISDAGLARIASCLVTAQAAQELQIVDASPEGEDDVYYFSDGNVLVATSHAWDDPDEGPMWFVSVYNADGTKNMEPEPYLDYLRQQANSGTLPRRSEASQEDAEWIRLFREDVVETKEQYEAQKREQYEQEGGQLEQPENVRF